MYTTENAVAWRLQEARSGNPAELFLDFCHSQDEAANVDLGRLYNGSLLFPSQGYAELREGDKPVPNTKPARPIPEIKPAYPGFGEMPYSHLGNERFAFVGYGAGTIIMASYFAMRGVQPANMTIIDPARRGGIWQRAEVQSGGFNNPKALAFYEDRLQLNDRAGEKMFDYLDDIAIDRLGNSHRVLDAATAVEKGRKDDAWRVQTADGATHEADYVVLATGTPKPRRIDSGRIRSNLDEVAASSRYSDDVVKVERHQRELSDEELASERPLVIIGLGNSTAAMLRKIHDYEDRTGKRVDYLVLTDWSDGAVYNPDEIVERDKSIFRKPAEGYLTGYSGDLPADKQAYERALKEWRIISDVRAVYLDEDGDLAISTARYNELHRSNAHVFALLGYERDDRLFRTAGALTQGWLRKEVKYPDIRPCDGAVRTQREGYMSNLFAVGAVAAGPGNLAAATVPGIQGQAVETLLTVAARSYVRAKSPITVLK